MTRRPAASQGAALAMNSSHEDVKEWMASILTDAQFTQVTKLWEASGEEPTGQVLLSTADKDLRRALHLPAAIAGKVSAHLAEARAAHALAQAGPSDDVTGESTPMVTNEEAAPQEVSLTAGATSGGAPRGRGRPPNAARQPRLSQRMEPLSSGRVEKRMTRQRATRVAAIQRAREGLQEAGAAGGGGGAEEGGGADDASEAGSEDTEAEEAPQQGSDHEAEVLQEEEEEDEEEAFTGPDEDDGVHPQNGATWEEAAREGLEDILKMLTVDQLIRIVEDQDWNDDVYRHRVPNKNYDPPRMEWKNRSRPIVAHRVVKMLLDGRLKKGRAETHEGGVLWTAVDDVLESYVGDDLLSKYLKERLKLQFAAHPRIRSPRAMLWRLWSRPPPPAGPDAVHLGRITIPYYRAGPELLQKWARAERDAEEGAEPSLAISAIWSALKPAAGAPAPAPAAVKPEGGGAGPVGGGAELVLMKNDEIDYLDLLDNVRTLGGRANAVVARCSLDPDSATLRVDLDVRTAGKGTATVQCCWVKKDAETGEPVLKQVYIDRLLAAMDHLKGTDLLEGGMEALNQEWDAACDDLDERQVPQELEPPAEVNSRSFDRIMAGVENLGREPEEGVEEDANDRLALRLKPYQLRALSFMLREERAAGGTARHLWLKLPLPGAQPGVTAWASPSLFQIHVSKSRIATEQSIGTAGGSGWQALEMGMGKTAVVLAGTLLNPPPPGWGARRAWAPYSQDDYLSTVADNMPRGGTLVIVPATIVRQWEMEVEKTLDTPEELSVLRWTEGKRELDCRVLADYDIVLTTPQSAAKTAHLASIFWHRIIVDEAQLNCGTILKGDFMSTHRWIVSGTPCNASVDSLADSLTFLRLGGFGHAQRHLPPALATVLRAAMCRYTKQGQIDGRTNLELPGTTHVAVSCTLNDADRALYDELNLEMYGKFKKHVNAGRVKSSYKERTLEEVLASPAMLNQLVTDGKINQKSMHNYLHALRSTVNGGHGQKTGELELDANGDHVHVVHWHTSKAEAVVAKLASLHAADGEAKILVFSEHNQLLSAIEDRLGDVGLESRSVIGSTSHKKRGDAIEAFMTDPPTKVFLLGAKPGAVGITLTAASVVVICEPMLNPALELQAIGRSQRLGQTKPVTVVRFCLADTVEERVRAVVARKASGGAGRSSTAAAANPGMAEVKCSVGDMNEMLRCEEPESEEEEDMEGEGEEVEDNY